MISFIFQYTTSVLSIHRYPSLSIYVEFSLWILPYLVFRRLASWSLIVIFILQKLIKLDWNSTSNELPKMPLPRDAASSGWRNLRRDVIALSN